MNKKILTLSILAILIMPMFISLVSAFTSADVQTYLNKTIDLGRPVLKWAIGTPDSATGADFGIQILVFILAVLIIYAVLDATQLFKNTGINVGIGIILSLIGIRFLPAGALEAMALPSSAMVAAMVLILPFIVVFYLVEKSSLPGAARRACWVVFGVLIAWLWVYNLDNPGLRGWLWLYPAIIVTCILAFMFDGTFQKWFSSAKGMRAIESVNTAERNMIIGEITKLQASRAAAMKSGDKELARIITKELENYRDTLKVL